MLTSVISREFVRCHFKSPMQKSLNYYYIEFIKSFAQRNCMQKHSFHIFFFHRSNDLPLSFVHILNAHFRIQVKMTLQRMRSNQVCSSHVLSYIGTNWFQKEVSKKISEMFEKNVEWQFSKWLPGSNGIFLNLWGIFFNLIQLWN